MLKYGNKKLEACTQEELIEACTVVHQAKLEAIAERDAYVKIIKGNYPVHKIWDELFERILTGSAIVLIVLAAIKAFY